MTSRNSDDLRKSRDIVHLRDQVGLDSRPFAVNPHILTTGKGLAVIILFPLEITNNIHVSAAQVRSAPRESQAAESTLTQLSSTCL